jgi:RimJ/RimL family protein N-acetyltransferase
MELVPHSVLLQGERITLRPMTEADWVDLMRWNNDPEVLYYSEGDDVQSYTIEDVQGIYRPISNKGGLCFIIEYQGRPIGDCWLQRMNLERVLLMYPGFDVRRIDLEIGEKELWGQGLGTEVIRLLTDFAFQQENVDYIFGSEIADYNLRSRRAFEKNDYRLVAQNVQPVGSKASYTFDMLSKNPRLGFHAYSIHLFFDPPTENEIRSIWRDLAETNTAPYFYESMNRPHITLSIYRSLDLPEARKRLAELSARQTALPISFPFHGIFPGSSPVTFLGPLVTSQLLELHASVCHLLDDLGELPEFDYYRPEHWVPHCGLAIEFNGSRLYDALEIGQHYKLPLNGEIREIGLTEMRPVRHLCQWHLQSCV